MWGEFVKIRKYYKLDKVKTLIKKKNLSYRRLAYHMGIGAQALSNKLNGYSVFNIDEVDLLIAILEIKESEITEYFFPGCCETKHVKRKNKKMQKRVICL